MPERIFISYAHRDGGDLALRLKGDLDPLGFDVWLDKHRLKGGDRWTNEIEKALDRAQVVLALLSDGSYASDTCRAEQGWALDAGKRVIPIRVQSNCRTPLLLHPLLHIDFSDQTNYAERFQELQQGLGDHRETAPPPAPQPRYNNAPALPDHFVDRPDLLTRLRDALFQEAPQRNIALTALHGMGGIGKTVLAQALCHDPAVRHAFPEGIFWFTIGRESRGFQQRVETVPELNQLLGACSGDDACRSQYRNALRDKAALIVLDDVWNAADIEPFRTESPRSRLLITTRDTGIAPSFGAREFTAELLADAEAREVLARWAGLQTDSLPPQANEVIDECKNLPLALAMIGAQLKDKPARHWDIVLGYLRRADLARIKARFPEPHTSLFRAIEVSFEALREQDAVASQRYLALAVLLEDMAAAPAVQQTLWNVDEAEALETSARFVDLSLAQRDQAVDSIRLHDLQLDYVRDRYPDPEALSLIHGAVRLSSHVIEKDPRQFASQVLGRLLPHRNAPAIQRFIDEIAAGAPAPWLRPLQPALHPPGTPLLRTLEGHSSVVTSVAVTSDGKRAVSASGDNTLKVWDLDTGRALRTLEGHSESVEGVALTPDGKRAVSASWDNTLKVWDLETGLVLRTLEGHSASVHGVTVTPDGKRAVSASWDNTLKVWDLETGLVLRTLEGHSDSVDGVALTPDGKRAVSASGDNTLNVWDLNTGRALRTLEGHSDCVFGVAVTPDGKRAVSASRDDTLKVWDLDSGHALRTLEGHSDSVFGVAVTPDGKRAVSASWDHTLKVWDLDTGRGLRTLVGHSASVSGVAVTPDGKRAISASWDHTLKVWDLETCRALRTLEGHSADVDGVAVTPDGKRAVSASEDRTVKVWDLDTGRALGTLEGHSYDVNGVAATPDGKQAISASWDKTLKVWDLDTGRALHTLEGHSAYVNGVAVTPDGKRAVSASADRTLKVWDLDTGLIVATFHCDAPAHCCACVDDQRIVAGDEGGRVYILSLEESGARLTKKTA